MLKVECESCKAPYQIDERRVPAAGLKMRCPKCGHSFVVKSPAAAGAPAAAAVPAAPPAPPAPRVAKTIEGPPPKPAPPVIAKPVAPEPKPSLPMALSVGDLDLPSPAADLPVAVPPRAGAPVVQKRGGGATIMGIPGPAAPRVVKAGSAQSSAAPPPTGKVDFDLDLPSLSAGPRRGDDADLPALAGDLPSVAAPRLAGRAPPPPPQANAPQVVKKPALKQTMAFGQNADLPALADAGLPAVGGRADLPVPANVGLPTPARAAQPAIKSAQPTAPGIRPAIKRAATGVGFGEIDLPVVANDLPTVASALPSVASALPSVASALPAVANALPAVANALPAVANALPAVANVLPTVQETSRQLPSIPAAFGGAGFGSLPPAFGAADDFGELELPRAPNDPLASPPPSRAGSFGQPSSPPGGSLFDENPFTSVAPPPAAPPGRGGDDAGFGELELPVAPENMAASAPPGAASASDRGGSLAGGMSFGELDLGGAESSGLGGQDFGEASLGSVIQPPPVASHGEVSRVAQLGQLPQDESGPADVFGGPAEATIDAPARPRRERQAERRRGPSPLPKILAVLLGAGVVGGAALTLTPYGPFGYYAVSDATHKNEYAKAATDALQKLHDSLKTDEFGDARAVSDQLAAARAAKPRARALTAVAAVAELETELRFGKEPERSNRAKVWLTSEIPEPRTNVRYLDVAMAAVSAIDRERDKARAGFDAAERKYAGDPIEQDIAFMRGQFELRSGDGAAAASAFKKALELAPGARAHFGLAQAAFMTGDLKLAWSELDETIAAAPKNGAALAVRAQLAWSQGHDDSAAVAALKDIATLLEGPARESISTEQRAQAYAQRGAIQFARGRTAEARSAFEDALKIDSRNVAALIGQGDVFYDEERNTEAIGRYDTAKQVDGNALAAIVGHAKTLIKLERLADAKTELADAVKRFPTSALAVQWLAEAEAALGNKRDAEKGFLAAIELADPKDPEAIDTYAAYAKFLSKQGRADEAQAKLLEAQKKLPDTAALERTLGDVADAQGNHEDAIKRYRAALAKDAQDVTSRFRLGQALRKANQPDEASKVFDQVYEADKNYPGLALERGLLFEQSGNVEEALRQFKDALDKHPNDPDLMLRVGAALVAIRKPEDALVNLKKVLQQRPNSAEAEHYMGRALMLKGGVYQQEAMRHLRTAAEKDPNRAEYHLYVGWLANDLTPPELGLSAKEISRALELDSTLADGFWQRGVLEFMSGATEDAAKDLRLALQLKPTRYEAHASLAQVYEQKNMVDQAIAEWNLAFARDADNELWNYKFGQLLLERGRYAEAAKHLKAATEAAEKDQPRPGWLNAAEYPTADALRRAGDKAGAIAHYTAFLQHADSNDPNNRDARRALVALGSPYQDDH